MQTPTPLQQHIKQTLTTGTNTPTENIEQEIENASAETDKIIIVGKPQKAIYFPVEWSGEMNALSCAIKLLKSVLNQ